MPFLARGTGRTRTGRQWTYVRDERPHGVARPPAAVFFASPDRRGARPLALSPAIAREALERIGTLYNVELRAR